MLTGLLFTSGSMAIQKDSVAYSGDDHDPICPDRGGAGALRDGADHDDTVDVCPDRACGNCGQ